MSRVIQIRDVPDETHDAIAEAAEAQGLSLTRFMLRELEQIAHRARTVEANARSIRQTQRRVGAKVDRAAIHAAIREGRDD
jgi:uncharacterized protein (DUF1778 family)